MEDPKIRTTPTELPWEIGKSYTSEIAIRSADISTSEDGENGVCVAVMCDLNEPDDTTKQETEAEANAALFLSSVNAMHQINRDDPRGAADGIVDLVEAAYAVIQDWENSDLASSVQNLAYMYRQVTGQETETDRLTTLVTPLWSVADLKYPETSKEAEMVLGASWYEDEDGRLYVLDSDITPLGTFDCDMAEVVGQLTKVDRVLHRYSIEDGFYHA